MKYFLYNQVRDNASCDWQTTDQVAGNRFPYRRRRIAVDSWLEHETAMMLPTPTGRFAVGRTTYVWENTALKDDLSPSRQTGKSWFGCGIQLTPLSHPHGSTIFLPHGAQQMHMLPEF
jgi:hypothetical protein